MCDACKMSAGIDGGEREGALLCVERYDEAWPGAFEAEATEIRAALGPMIVEVEHVGSTAVPGLDANPILDLLVVVRSWDTFEALVGSLAALGYEYTPFEDTDDPRVFRKGPLDQKLLRTHHVHVSKLGSSYSKRLIAFRDHLRANNDDAAAYASLKRALVQRFASQPDQYTDAKTDFVRAVEAKAGLNPSANRWD